MKEQQPIPYSVHRQTRVAILMEIDPENPKALLTLAAEMQVFLLNSRLS